MDRISIITLALAKAYTNSSVAALEQVVRYIGVTTTAISDGSTTNPITINGQSVTAVAGDTVFYNGTSYAWDGSAWQEVMNIAEIISSVEELQDDMGDLSDLTTVDKSDLVAAINELVSDKQNELTAGDYISLDGNTVSVDPDKEADALVLASDISTASKTATGNPIIITDAAAVAAESLELTLPPKQDLHGLPFPYVGGAYKNKLPMTVASIKAANTDGTWSGNVYTLNNTTFEILTDETNVNVHGVKANTGSGGASADALFNVSVSDIKSGSYIMSGATGTGGTAKYFFQARQSSASIDVKDYGSGANLTLASDTSDITFRAVIKSGFSVSNLMFYPMLRLSTESDSSFAPYSNECPITGRTQTSVESEGANKVNLNYFKGSSGVTKNVSGDRITVIGDGTIAYQCVNLTPDGTSGVVYFPAGTYYMKFKVISATTFASDVQIGLRKANHVLVNPVICSGVGEYTKTVTISEPCYLSVVINGDGNKKVANTVVLDDFILSTIDINYVPYQAPSSATIQLGQTVYGADINWDTGVVRLLDVKEVLTDISQLYGSTPQISGSGNWMGMQISSLPLIEAANINLKCSIAKPVSYNNRTAGDVVGTDRTYIDSDPNGVIILHLSNERSDITTKADFFAHFTGAEVCYKLATPIEIDLTPAQLELLKGYNYITADGDMVLLYQPDNTSGDIKSWVEQKIQTASDALDASKVDNSVVGDVENGTTASRAYAVGEHFIRNKKFCTAIAAIASGATLTLNTNYKEGSISDNLVYKAGDSVALGLIKTVDGVDYNAYGNFASCLTSSGENLFVTIPLDKPCIANGISFSNDSRITLSGGSGYIINSQEIRNYTVLFIGTTASGLSLVIKNADGTAISTDDSNKAVNTSLTGTITFT